MRDVTVDGIKNLVFGLAIFATAMGVAHQVGRPAKAQRVAEPLAARPAIAEIPEFGFPEMPRRPGITGVGHVTEVIDGDTIVVAVTHSMHLRLENCWCAEKFGPTKEEGLRAKREMIRLAAGKDCYFNIPVRDDLGDSTTLGRFLARVWIVGQRDDLSSQMVSGGFAKPSKPVPEK